MALEMDILTFSLLEGLPVLRFENGKEHPDTEHKGIVL